MSVQRTQDVAIQMKHALALDEVVEGEQGRVAETGGIGSGLLMFGKFRDGGKEGEGWAHGKAIRPPGGVDGVK